MKTFEMFKREVRDMGGIWSGGDVRFFGLADAYGSIYRPYSSHTAEDCAITYNTLTDTYTHIGPEEWHRKYIETKEDIA